jgi:hypothetical protein
VIGIYVPVEHQQAGHGGDGLLDGIDHREAATFGEVRDALDNR